MIPRAPPSCAVDEEVLGRQEPASCAQVASEQHIPVKFNTGGNATTYITVAATWVRETTSVLGGSENWDTLSRIAGRLSDNYWGGGGVPGCAANPRELGDQLPSRVAHGDDGDPSEEQQRRHYTRNLKIIRWK